MELIKVLFLLEPARFVTKLKNISIPMRQKLHLQCTFKGAPKMFVTWYKDGKQLYASYRYNTKVTGNTCSIDCLYECNKDTPGVYACEVSNAYGTEICYANVSVITGQSCIWVSVLLFPEWSVKKGFLWECLEPPICLISPLRVLTMIQPQVWRMHGCIGLNYLFCP